MKIMSDELRKVLRDVGEAWEFCGETWEDRTGRVGWVGWLVGWVVGWLFLKNSIFSKYGSTIVEVG